MMPARRRSQHSRQTPQNLQIRAQWLENSAEVEVAAPLERCWGLWEDQENIPNWMPWISSVKVSPPPPLPPLFPHGEEDTRVALHRVRKSAKSKAGFVAVCCVLGRWTFLVVQIPTHTDEFLQQLRNVQSLHLCNQRNCRVANNLNCS